MTGNSARALEETIGEVMVNNSKEIHERLSTLGAAHMVLNRLDTALSSLGKTLPPKPVNKTALAWAMQETLGDNVQRNGAYKEIMSLIGLDPDKSYQLTDEIRGILNKDFAAVSLAQAAG